MCPILFGGFVAHIGDLKLRSVAVGFDVNGDSIF